MHFKVRLSYRRRWFGTLFKCNPTILNMERRVFMDSWIKGADLSSLLEVEECGGHFSDKGISGNALEILKSYGMNMVRLRLWNDPYSPDGEPYGAGTCDLAGTMIMARRVKKAGMEWMLDFHYSDAWADPGKQIPPKAWQGMNVDELEKAVYDYTFSVMTVLKEEGLLPAIVAVGNELSSGLLWPFGQFPNFENIARFVNAGIRAVHQADADVSVMIHLDNGGNNAFYRNWFDQYFACGGLDFDYIGLSYYPFWHGTMEELEANMNDLAVRYKKDMIIVETSSGFTLEDYAGYEKLPDAQRKGMAANAKLAKEIPYAMTPEGQCGFMQKLMGIIKNVPDGKGKGFIYWEAAWIPVPGSGWANAAAIAYMKEKGPGGNEWANQALFDYEGRTLPALETIRDFKG